MNQKIKFFALGGLDENGKNMYCLEIDDDIFVIEAGLKYPESQSLGIDIEIPTFDYLIENEKRVKGIFLTHAHPDAMGAISYLLKEISPTIYASHLTSWIVEDRLKEAGIKKYTIKRIKENSIIKIKDKLRVHTFKTTHSIIQSLGLAFETEQGFIVFTSDFIIDFGSTDGYQTDVYKLVDIAKKGVLLLMTESIGANKTGHTSPNHKITSMVEPIISNAPSRIIVTAYTHSMYNIQEIVNVAIKYNYRIIFLNKDLQDLVHKHEKLGLPIVPKDKITNIKDIDKGDVLVVISGNGSDLYEQLSRIATKEDSVLKPTQKDTFIIASPAIPGIENLSIKAIDDIYRLDSDVYTFSSKNIASMHASQEDIKMMINLFKPKYYLPVKGEYTQLMANANIAYEMGIPADNVIVLENGEVVNFKDNMLQEKREHIEVGSMLIDGQTVNDNNGIVLNDRLSLSQDGTVIIGIGLDKKTKEQTMSMDIQTRGFIYIKDSEYIITEIKKIVNETLEQFTFKDEQDFNDAKAKIRENVSRYIYKETNKRPIVLSMIITV
ncbi:ribonuclease J [Bacilli bacterium PM5-3]|nr:ribonuclease J [Bacilli bacterium PM5-3]MDH6603051.1 ribonuclease J [Bacilli bacterium PM5-9]